MNITMLSMAEWWQSVVAEFTRTMIVDERWKMFLSGLGVTLMIWFFALLLGVVIGVVVAFGKLSRFKLLNWISNVYIDIIRGTPTMVQIMIIYFIIFASVAIDRRLVAIIGFGINSGAYVAEIIRGGILSVNKGQMEAGRSLGLTHMETMFRVILPQAIKNILPALGNEAIVLVKETAVIGYIAKVDLTAAALQVQSRTYSYLGPLLAIAIIYYVVIKIMSILLGILEKKLRKSDIR